MVADFVRKAVGVMRNSLKRTGKEEISLTIAVRHKISDVTYWRSCYISESAEPKQMSLLSRKMDDWQ